MQRIILCLLLFGESVFAQETSSIRVDQFGYMTAMPKLAFWVDPV